MASFQGWSEAREEKQGEGATRRQPPGGGLIFEAPKIDEIFARHFTWLGLQDVSV